MVSRFTWTGSGITKPKKTKQSKKEVYIPLSKFSAGTTQRSIFVVFEKLEK